MCFDFFFFYQPTVFVYSRRSALPFLPHDAHEVVVPAAPLAIPRQQPAPRLRHAQHGATSQLGRRQRHVTAAPSQPPAESAARVAARLGAEGGLLALCRQQVQSVQVGEVGGGVCVCVCARARMWACVFVCVLHLPIRGALSQWSLILVASSLCRYVGREAL